VVHREREGGLTGTIAPIVDRIDPRAFPWPELGGDVAFVDIETSGGTAPVTRVIEIGIVRVSRDGQVRRFESLVDPEGPVTTTFVHGLEPADLEGAPTFRALWPTLVPWLQDAIVVAHNASFERGHLARELERLGGTFGAPVLCTLKLARHLHPDRAGRGAHSLAGLQELYGLEPSGHEALADAECLAVLFSRWCATDERVADAVQELLEPPAADWSWPDVPGRGAKPLPRRPVPVTGWFRRALLVAAIALVGVAAWVGWALGQ